MVRHCHAHPERESSRLIRAHTLHLVLQRLVAMITKTMRQDQQAGRAAEFRVAHVPRVVGTHGVHHVVNLGIGNGGRKNIPLPHLRDGLGAHLVLHAVQLATEFVRRRVVHHVMLVLIRLGRGLFGRAGAAGQKCHATGQTDQPGRK